jgi:hypothetical protein
VLLGIAGDRLQIVQETLSQKILHKNRAGGVAQGEGPEFKSQYHKKKEGERLADLFSKEKEKKKKHSERQSVALRRTQ